MTTLSELNVRTGVKRKVARDWICYHDPTVMEYPAADADPTSVETRKPLKSQGVIGDRIWLLSRNAKGDKYFVHSYFTVTEYRLKKVPRGMKPLLILSGRPAWQFRRKVRVDEALWFQQYKDEMRGLSHGLQRIKNADILHALVELAKEYRANAV